MIDASSVYCNGGDTRSAREVLCAAVALLDILTQGENHQSRAAILTVTALNDMIDQLAEAN